jgi:hypothetical protein
VGPEDVAATIYQRFAIRPEQEILSYDSRPYRVLPVGATPLRELG